VAVGASDLVEISMRQLRFDPTIVPTNLIQLRRRQRSVLVAEGPAHCAAGPSIPNKEGHRRVLDSDTSGAVRLYTSPRHSPDTVLPCTCRTRLRPRTLDSAAVTGLRSPSWKTNPGTALTFVTATTSTAQSFTANPSSDARPTVFAIERMGNDLLIQARCLILTPNPIDRATTARQAEQRYRAE
jgi:hypothetical protein